MSRPNVGETHTVARTFTREDVRQFAGLSGDTQARHTESDSSGRLLVHGLLTATLPTQLGGDLDVLARSMAFEFEQPVYTDERITCSWTNESVDSSEDRHELAASVVCENADADVVLTGSIEGIIWKEHTESASGR